MSDSNINRERIELRRANDVMRSDDGVPPAQLFDRFWSEGELALMFGPAGVGKSLLAVEIADALAKGRSVAGMHKPYARRNVLYIDLVLSEDQFRCRYSRLTQHLETKRYKFSSRLFYENLETAEGLYELVHSAVVNDQVSVVIIDDLSMISNSDDGTREKLELVQKLRLLARRYYVSVLVLADSLPSVFERPASERDLRRSRMLCSYVDSVFCISNGAKANQRFVVQTRSRAGELFWTHRSPARFNLVERNDGFIGFEYDELMMSQKEFALICRIKKMRDSGKTFRAIAATLEMSKSTVCRHLDKWRPEFDEYEVPEDEWAEKDEEPGPTEPVSETKYPDYLEPLPEVDYFGQPPDDEYENPAYFPDYKEKYDRPLKLGEMITSKNDGGLLYLPAAREYSFVFDPRRIPFAAGLGRQAIRDLELSWNSHGREIFVESRHEITGKPTVWYQYNGKSFTRHERNTFGIIARNVGSSGFVT